MKIKNQLILLIVVAIGSILVLIGIMGFSFLKLQRISDLRLAGLRAQSAMSALEAEYKDLLITSYLQLSFPRFKAAGERLERALPAFLDDELLVSSIESAGDEIKTAHTILLNARQRSNANVQATIAAIQDSYGDELSGVQGLFLEMALHNSTKAFAGYTAATAGYKSIQGVVADNMTAIVDYLDATLSVRELRRTVSTVAIYAAALSLVTLIYLIAFSRSLRSRIERLRAYMGGVAGKDLSGSSGVRGSDEIAQLSGYIDSAVGDIRSILDSLKQRARESEENSGMVREAIAAVRESVEGIAGEVEVLDGRFESARAGIASSSAAVEQIASSVGSIAALMERQKGLIAESAASTEEIERSIESINAMTRARQENADSLVAIADSGRIKTERTNERVQGILALVGDIKGISDTIAKIASRTNLLAMNAAIEAAHAGASGAGFAVVAQEIRTLAESTALNSKQIKEIIASISASIVEASTESSANASSYSEISDEVARFSQAFREIGAAMNEIVRGSRDMVGIGSSLSNITAEVMTGYGEIKGGIESNREEMTGIDESMNVLAAGVESISRLAKAIEGEMKRITDLQAASGESSRDLAAGLDRFKT